MSHQTGIQPDDTLRKFMTKAKCSAKTRVFKVCIKEENLILDEDREPKDKWSDDYVQHVTNLVEPGHPCYLLFRMDSKDASTGVYHWHLIVWSPEGSPVREKMLYASTKSSFKKEFGNITLDYFASTQEELSLPSYLSYLERKRNEENGEPDENLLTVQEQEMRQVRKEEAISSTATKPTNTLPGVEFPLNDDVVKALKDLKDGTVSYIQLGIDIKLERITLEKRESHKEFEVNSLPSKLPPKCPRYHLFLFPHTHNGLYHNSTVFVYSLASCSVKERMLYSSCKNNLIHSVTNRFEITIDKKLEIDDPSELNEDYLIDQIHPKEVKEFKKGFDKPAGPAKRGLRRLIKSGE